MKRLLILSGLICAFLSSTQSTYSAEGCSGHNWDEVIFTSRSPGVKEEVQVHAKLTQAGRPSFQFLVVNVGDIRINVPEELLKQIDWPDLRSFLLMSDQREGRRVILLSVRLLWKSPIEEIPRYIFEFAEGKLQALYTFNGPNKEKTFLYRGG